MSGPPPGTGLTLLVDLSSPVPPFEQVRSQVAAHVSAGALHPGDRLPTVRALAADLGIAVGTVARAYQELEAQGLVASRRRTGTVVLAAPAGGPADDAVLEAAEAVARAARAAGWAEDRVVTAVRGALLRAAEPEPRSLARSRAGPPLPE